MACRTVCWPLPWKGVSKPNKANVLKPLSLAATFRETGNRYEKQILRQDQILKNLSPQNLKCDNWLHIFSVSWLLQKQKEKKRLPEKTWKTLMENSKQVRKTHKWKHLWTSTYNANWENFSLWFFAKLPRLMWKWKYYNLISWWQKFILIAQGLLHSEEQTFVAWVLENPLM